jgi:hypothetical protein
METVLEFLAAMVLVGAHNVAFASRPADSSSAPVRLTSCEAFPERLLVTPNGHYYQEGHVPVLQRNDPMTRVTAMHLGAHLTNGSEKPATNVEVRFEIFDKFNRDTGYRYTTTYNADFRTNVDVDRQQHDMAYMPINQKASAAAPDGHVICSVTAVRFKDGSTWVE